MTIVRFGPLTSTVLRRHKSYMTKTQHSVTKDMDAPCVEEERDGREDIRHQVVVTTFREQSYRKVDVRASRYTRCGCCSQNGECRKCWDGEPRVPYERYCKASHQRGRIQYGNDLISKGQYWWRSGGDGKGEE